MSSELTKHHNARKHYEEVRKLLIYQKLSIVEVGKHLSALRKDGRFRYVFGDSDRNQSWAEWVKFEFKISESYASRSIDVYQLLVQELGVSKEDIMSYDQNTLYLLMPAYKQGKITESQLRKYLPLPRNEVREEINPHEHEWDEDNLFIGCKYCEAKKKYAKRNF